MKTKHISVYGMLIALAFILSYVESLIPLPLPIPGVKIGLANLVVIVALYTMGAKEAFVLSMLRIILVGFTFGNLSTMMFSFAGGILSWFLMAIFRKSKLFSITGISIVGGVSHNIGQILAAMWVVDSVALVYYLPFLLIAGALMGVVIGVVGSILVNRIKMIDKE